MALYPFNVVRVSLEGTCFDGNEIWQTGFWLGNPSTHAEEPTLAKAEAIATAFGSFISNSTSGISNRYTLTTCRMTYHQATGGTNRDLTVIYDLPVPVNGGSAGGNPQAPQISLVATLMTALLRGRASKGRMFLPIGSFTVGVNGTFLASNATSVAANLAFFINQVNLAGSGDDDVCNVSPVNLAGLFPGRIEIVQAVRVGNVYDTQRRRRNAIPETYQTAPLPG